MNASFVSRLCEMAGIDPLTDDFRANRSRECAHVFITIQRSAALKEELHDVIIMRDDDGDTYIVGWHDDDGIRKTLALQDFT